MEASDVMSKSEFIPVDRAALHPDSLRSWCIPEDWRDETFKCVDCGQVVRFSARQQRDWYEVQKRPIFERPNRCAVHFQAWRQGRRAKFAMDRRLALLEGSPNDMKVVLDAALSIVRYHEQTSQGNLALALCLLRRLNSRKKPIAKAVAYCESTLATQAK